MQSKFQIFSQQKKNSKQNKKTQHFTKQNLSALNRKKYDALFRALFLSYINIKIRKTKLVVTPENNNNNNKKKTLHLFITGIVIMQKHERKTERN